MSTLTLVGASARKLPPRLYRIKYAEVTDTRLMGVLGMHICWEARRGQEVKSFLAERNCTLKDYVSLYHQIYYYEVEENGLETVAEVLEDDQAVVGEVKNRFFGGLGCPQMVEISEKEALWLIRRFVDDTKAKSGTTELINVDDEIPDGELFKDGMPKSLEELYQELQGRELLTEDEVGALMAKICAPVRTECAAINYYLMRSFGHDREGAAFVTSPLASSEYLRPVELSERAILRKNVIQLCEEGNGSEVYLCESVLECRDSFYAAFSEIELSDMMVVASKLNASFRLSDAEASKKVRRNEYIAFFEIAGLGERNPEDILAELLPKASRKYYEAGILFMDYNSNNDHVDNPVYNLSDDLMASYFLTDTDQLLVATNDASRVMNTEIKLLMSPLGRHLAAKGRYSFAYPLLGDFIDSGLDDFYEYLRNIME